MFVGGRWECRRYSCLEESITCTYTSVKDTDKSICVAIMNSVEVWSTATNAFTTDSLGFNMIAMNNGSNSSWRDYSCFFTLFSGIEYTHGCMIDGTFADTTDALSCRQCKRQCQMISSDTAQPFTNSACTSWGLHTHYQYVRATFIHSWNLELEFIDHRNIYRNMKRVKYHKRQKKKIWIRNNYISFSNES